MQIASLFKDIAVEPGVSSRTVSRAIACGGEPAARKAGARASKLDPYTARIDQMPAGNIWNGSVIWRLLKAGGYQGGRTLINDYIQPKRPLRPAQLGTVRFETAPGHQLQHDGGEIVLKIGGQEQKVYLAVNSLGYARAVHVVAMASMDAEHTYEATQQGFDYQSSSFSSTRLAFEQNSTLQEFRRW